MEKFIQVLIFPAGVHRVQVLCESMFTRGMRKQRCCDNQYSSAASNICSISYINSAGSVFSSAGKVQICTRYRNKNASKQEALRSVIYIFTTILGTRAIRVDWVHPNELNGVLESYVLFASDTFIYEIGEEVYNSTDSFTYYNLNDLAPGTTYFIRLSVSVLNQL